MKTVKCTIELCFLALLLNLTGCLNIGAGMAAGAMHRSNVTDTKDYRTALNEAGAIPAGQARIVIYTVGGAPNAANTTGSMSLLSVGKSVYSIMGESYFIADAPAGPQEITTNGIAGGFEGLTGREIRRGSLTTSAKLSQGKCHFVRVEMNDATYVRDKAGPARSIRVVSESVAKSELGDLGYYTGSKTVFSLP